MSEKPLDNTIYNSKQLSNMREYWLCKLNDELHGDYVTYDVPKAAFYEYKEETANFIFSDTISERLNNLSNNADLRLFMVLTAGITALLHKYSGEEEIGLVTPIYKQEVEANFINTVLVLRNKVTSRMTFKELLLQVREDINKSGENQNYPVLELLERLEIPYSGKEQPLLEAAVLLKSIHDRSYMDGINLNIVFSFYKEGNCIGLDIDFNSLLYCRDSIERLFFHLSCLLKEALENVNKELLEIVLIPQEEEQRLLHQFNDTKVEYSKHNQVHTLFEKQTERTPDNTAVVFEDRHMSYNELNCKANQLARYLRKKGIKQDSVVGIIAHKSLEMIIAIFAVLKAGGAYLPIEPGWPANRINYILKDSGAVMVLTKKGSDTSLGELSLECEDLDDENLYCASSEDLDNINSPDDLAYLIYTSGTTGIPKGVMIERRGFSNTIQWRRDEYKLNAGDSVLQLFSYAFDGFITSFFTPVVSGAKVVLLNDEKIKNVIEIRKNIIGHKITHFISVPILYSAILDCLSEEDAKSLKIVTLAGDKVTESLISKSLEKNPCIEIVNEYGPTENSVASTIQRHLEKEGVVTIGKPIANTRAYILDKHGRVQPIGVIGELCLAGDGLARGYINMPEMTKEKFTSVKMLPEERIYKTGDLARYLPCGSIEYIGRADYQIKLRGFRVELGEIETQISNLEFVNRAVVIDREDSNGNKYIVAYVVADRELSVQEWREYLAEVLPDYMIPSYFVHMEEIPLTLSGKVNRKVLPEPKKHIMDGNEYVAPQNETEKRLQAIWQEILEMDGIGVDSNFFELGGHSIKVTALVSRIHKEFNVEVPLGEIFKLPTIRSLAKYLISLEKNIFTPLEVLKKDESNILIADYADYMLCISSAVQKRLFVLNKLEGSGVGYNTPVVVTCESFIEKERIERAFQVLIDRHESLRTAFDMIDGEVVQKIYKKSDIEIEYLEAQESDTEKLIGEFIRPFDLGIAPLLRIRLVWVDRKKFLMMFDSHHVISDGISMGIFLKELGRLYNGETLPELKLQYRDYIAWQNSLYKSGAIKKQEDHWLGVFKNEIPVLNMPTDFIRPTFQSFEGDSLYFYIDKASAQGLEAMALETGTTLYMVLLSAFNVLLSRYSGQGDIIIGSPISGRSHNDLENIIGMFVNTLPMRNYIGMDMTITEVLIGVKENTIKAFENQDYQFNELIEKLNIQRDLSRNPIFDVMFSMQNMGISLDQNNDLKLTQYQIDSKISKFDLTLVAVRTDDGIGFDINYCTRLYKRETIERMAQHFVNIIHTFVKAPETRVKDIDMLTEAEKRQLIFDFNDTAMDYPQDKPVHKLIEEQVGRKPEGIALVCGEVQLTYKELNERANRLAYILKNKGVEQGSTVGVMLERSTDMIVGILAVLKAGGSYIPIDPGYPRNRVSYMLSNSKTSVLLTTTKIIEGFGFNTLQNISQDSIDIICSEPREQIKEFDKLPIPDRSLVDYEKYHKKGCFPKNECEIDTLKILFLDLSTDFSNQSSSMLYEVVEEPIALMYLLTYLNNELEGKVNGRVAKSRIDFDSYEELKSLINEFKPDIIEIRTLTNDKNFFHKTVSLIRQWCINIPIIAGGPYAASNYSRILKDRNIDLVILGEGEITLKELAEKIILNNKEWLDEKVLSSIPGVAFLSRSSSTALKGLYREIIMLDDIEESLMKESEENLPHQSCKDNIIYQIYTSGSTGEPKGVMVKSHAFTNLINWYNHKFDISEKDRILLIASVSFDLAQKNLFAPLIAGGRLYLLETALYDYSCMADIIEKEEITIINCTPSAFYQLVYLNRDSDFRKLRSLRYVFLGGEPISLSKVMPFISSPKCSCKIVNTYGPTECTDIAASFTLKKEDLTETSIVPIGKPVYNAKLYVLDKNKRILPVGIPGELYIGGIGLAKGYMGDDELTSERFVNIQGIPEEKVYKTGDLVRWLNDGNIEFLGRIDYQVKIRGFRVELGEIENHILRNRDVEEAAVIEIKENGVTESLCAYFVSQKDISGSELKEKLLNELPEYMIPSYFVKLDEMPLTPSGKIDRRALQLLFDNYNNTIAATVEEPFTKIESEVAEIFQKVLSVNKVGLNDNFFDIGGHSLKATALMYKLNESFGVEVPIREVFRLCTVKEISKFISTSRYKKHTCINKAPEKDYYLASSAQKRLYIIREMQGTGITYNMPLVMLVEGKIDTRRLEEAFATLIERHEALRTCFTVLDGEIMQVINRDILFNVDFLECKEENLDNEIRKYIRPFDLNQAPLFRAGIINFGELRSALILDIHHIISDGMSVSILLNELIKLYSGENLQMLRLQYKDFSEWQNALFNTEIIKKQEDYWLNKFSGEIPVLNISTDYPRPSVQSFKGDSMIFKIDKKTSIELNTLAKEAGATLYMVLLAVYNVLLAKYCAQEDIIVGTPVAGRHHGGLEDLVGMFVNTLAMRNYPKGSKSFREFLADVKENALEAYENQDYQFETLVEKLEIPRELSRNPLFDTMFTLQNIEINKLETDGMRLIPYNFEYTAAKFDLMLSAMETASGIVFRLEYCSELFNRETIKKFTKRFVKIIKQVTSNPDLKILDIKLLLPQEKKFITDLNKTRTDYPRNSNIKALFEEQVEKVPDRIALVHGTNKMTYRELNGRADSLAGILTKKGVKPGQIVGILVDRSVETIIGILAIIKAGGAYLPIDRHLPEERIVYMLNDSGASVLIVHDDRGNLSGFAGVMVVSGEDIIVKDYAPNTKISLKSKDLAYIMYTSGSSGKPKGVLIEHRSVIRLVKDTGFITFREDDCILQTGNMTFDACTFEIWAALLNGLRLCLVGESTILNEVELEMAILQNHATIMWLTSPLFNQLSQRRPGMFSELRYLLVGGDILSPKHINRVRQECKNLMIINAYGPTENTTFSTCFLIDRDYSDNIPIGRPISNSTAYILDNEMKLLPPGIHGELYLGGDGVARGYLSDQQLTKEKFVKNPFNPSGCLYRTGDMARWLPDGNIEFLGRLDNQIKIRGFRVELQEIEAKLLSLSYVKEAAVVAYDMGEGDKVLCAYMTSDTNLNISEIKELMSGELPKYMIPAYFVQLDVIPLTSNGKIDRKQLLKPGNDSFRVEYIPPSSDTEKKIVKIWEETLGIQNIGLNDNFFELGGNSLKAMQVVSRLAVDYRVNINHIFEHQTVASLSQHIIYMKDDLKNRLETLKSISANGDVKKEDDGNVSKKLVAAIDEYRDRINSFDKDVTKQKKYKSIMLTGATGYIGIHLLYKLLHRTSSDIYLLVRGADWYEAQQRIKHKLEFYFGDSIYTKFADRIHLLNGDISKDQLGLERDIYLDAANSIECVIHSAANVRHYGKYDDFYNENVYGTQNIIKFCETGLKKDLNLISTLSVATGNVKDREHILFTEYEGDLGQVSSSYYVSTKIESEKLVVDARERGLRASIFRIGNAVFQSDSGKFQENIENNAFYALIKAYLKLGVIPEIKQKVIDFSFVDYVSEAIVLLFDRVSLQDETFHLLNKYRISYVELGKMLHSVGYNVKILNMGAFIDFMLDHHSDPDIKTYIENILINYNLLDHHTSNETNFIVVSDKTEFILDSLGFSWKRPGREQIRKMLDYCKKVDFI